MDGRYSRTSKACLPWLGPSILPLLTSVLVFILAPCHEPSDIQCVRHRFSWSPAIDSIKYHHETFDNIDFFTETPYFGLVPTQEIEDAWNEILPSAYIWLFYGIDGMLMQGKKSIPFLFQRPSSGHWISHLVLMTPNGSVILMMRIQFSLSPSMLPS